MSNSYEETVITLLSEILGELKKTNSVEYSVKVVDNVYRSGEKDFIKAIQQGLKEKGTRI